jgi:hypothetical protein
MWFVARTRETGWKEGSEAGRLGKVGESGNSERSGVVLNVHFQNFVENLGSVAFKNRVEDD